MSLLFSSFTLSSPKGPLTLPNRIVIAPMCQYSAVNGEAQDWHLMHWGNLLNGGAGLFIIEATGVTPEGRITPACLGLWDDRTEAALKDKLSRARKLAPATPVFIQLAHAGRKASSATPWEGGQLLSLDQGGWETLAPSAIPQLKDERLPHELSKTELADLINAFVVAAQRAERVGVDGIELHGAHGYLIDQFLRDGTNQRTDQYGGSIENRTRLLQEVTATLVDVLGKGRVAVRLSPNDGIQGVDDSDTYALFDHAAKVLNDLGIAFLEIRDPLPEGTFGSGLGPRRAGHLKTLFKGPLIDTADYTADSAIAALAAGHADGIAFGCPYIANPDLVERIAAGQPWASSNPAQWYSQGAEGYTDYPAFNG